MISKHSEAFHPQGRTKKGHYKLSEPIIIPKSLFCICGFSSRSGNHLGECVVTLNHVDIPLLLLVLVLTFVLTILEWYQLEGNILLRK